MKLVWQPQALDDLKNIQRYIAMDNPTAANRIVKAIASSVHNQLTEFPESGRIGRVEGTRELLVTKTPFIVPYRIKGTVIDVLGVYHTARRWPERS